MPMAQHGGVAMTVGRTLFWLFTAATALLLLWVVSDVFWGMSNDYPPTINITGLVLAVVIGAIGWFCRYAFL
jgi:hypothetical protein